MKRLVWLLIAVFCTALAQVQPVDMPVTKHAVCGCCGDTGACGMPDCVSIRRWSTRGCGVWMTPSPRDCCREVSPDRHEGACVERICGEVAVFVIIGFLLVVAAVGGGYGMEGGNFMVLVQPAEFVIIGGAALGSLLIGTPPSLLKRLVSQLMGLIGGATSKEDYQELLAMSYQLFKVAQQSGVMALEPHFEKPAESTILAKYPKFLTRHHAVDFLADSVKVIIVGGIGPHDFENLMDLDLEVRHHEALAPAGTLNKVSDAMPGLGIVAAVLGVVITMGVIDGPASEIGHKVGAALVGTFLGILMSYGFMGPLATNMEQKVESEGYYEKCIKAGLLAMYKGFSPMVAVEFARRVLPDEVRPTFDETEKLCKNTREAASAAA